MKDQTYIEKVKVYKVANGHVIQITKVGEYEELTFVCTPEHALGDMITYAIAKSIEEKH
jgi:hypothetical protein